jgi:hypothetical protein
VRSCGGACVVGAAVAGEVLGVVAATASSSELVWSWGPPPARTPQIGGGPAARPPHDDERGHAKNGQPRPRRGTASEFLHVTHGATNPAPRDIGQKADWLS